MLNFNATWFRYVPTACHIVQVFFADGQSILIAEWSGEIVGKNVCRYTHGGMAY